MLYSEEIQKTNIHLQPSYFDPLGKFIKIPTENEFVPRYSKYELRDRFIIIIEMPGPVENVEFILAHRPGKHILLVKGTRVKP